MAKDSSEFEFTYQKVTMNWILYLSGALCAAIVLAYLFIPYGIVPYALIALLAGKAVCDYTFSRLTMVEIYKKYYQYTFHHSAWVDIATIATLVVSLSGVYPLSLSTILWGWLYIQLGSRGVVRKAKGRSLPI